jgi:hypothetical protein
MLQRLSPKKVVSVETQDQDDHVDTSSYHDIACFSHSDMPQGDGKA